MQDDAMDPHGMAWWEFLVVWTVVGALLGCLGGLAHGSPRDGIMLGIPGVHLAGATLELWRQHRETSVVAHD